MTEAKKQTTKKKQTSKITVQFKREQFEQAVRRGVAIAAIRIVKISEKCAKTVKDSLVGDLADHINSTIKVFVTDKGDGVLLRYSLMSDIIVKRIAEERGKLITSIDTPKKISDIGEAYGVMAGIATFSSVVRIFLDQAVAHLKDREDLSGDAKQLFLEYIKDAFNVVMMSLSNELDAVYRPAKKERAIFADILSSNTWDELYQDAPNEAPIS